MRPLELKLSGLQSYREEQVIDFTQLCDAGVFGIFGPTGSGKSTILDAITLALYARVERANNETQGIMNHAEDQLSVSFTFALMHAEGMKRYRVERQFKRSSDISISSAVSRMIQLGDNGQGDVVLADRAREVTERVQHLLGLSVDDFTRAVVLPQGKFAEFLYLKGSERRQMLQRLFSLEQYGDVLQMKLSQRIHATKNERDQLLAEQQGLGEASAEAMKQAELALQQAVEAAQAARKHAEQVETQYKRDEQIWQWQTERNKLAAELQSLQMKQGEIAEREQQLLRAEQAERLRPHADRWQTAKQRAAELHDNWQAKRKVYEQAEQDYEKIRKQFVHAEQQLEEHEERLLVQQTKGQQALQIEQELVSLQHKQAEQKAKQAALQKEVEAMAKQKEESEARLQAAQSEQAKRRQQLQQLSVSTADSRRLHSAWNDKKAIDDLHIRFTNIVDQVATQQNHMIEQKEQIAAAEAEYAAVRHRIEQIASQMSLEDRQLAQAARAVAKLEQCVRERIAKQQVEEAQRTVREQAALLAEQLIAGEPCPVCGSVHHPEPALAMPEQSDAELAQDSRSHSERYSKHGWDELLVNVQQLGLQLQQSRMVWQTEHNQLTDLLPANVGDEVAATKLDSDETAAEIDVNDESDERALFTSYDHWVNTIALHKQHIADQQSALQDARREEKQRSGQISERKAELQAAQQYVAHLLEQQSAVQAELTAKKQQWREQYPHDELTQIEQIMQQLVEREQEAERLAKLIAEKEQSIEQTKAELDTLQQQSHEWEQKLLTAKLHVTNTEETIAAQMKAITELIGSHKASDLLNQTELELARLRTEAKETKAAYEAAEQRLQQTKLEVNRAEEAAQSAAQYASESEQQWREIIQGTPFATTEQVYAALLAEEKAATYAEQIKLHRERERDLEGQLSRLHNQLNERSLSSEAWEESKQRLQAAKEQVEKAIQDEARAKRDLEDVRTRHERWQQLQGKVETLNRLSEQLGKLQRVFRGNAFVEFIAEEQLQQVSYAASQRLGDLTRQRYALELDSSGGFVIRDDANGGVKRPASTLSGGESFLTSLSLALALSAQIQLGGQYPLQFFFLDEGFGTLDPDMLDTVVTALEKLHSDQLTVGVISHVPELRARLPRKLIVHPAEPSGRGSIVTMEAN